MVKVILDACCGSRMFWFDKKQPNTLFCDIREYDKGFIDNRKNRELHPDKIMDFRKMDFSDKSFKLVVFDPPHLIGKPNGCRMTKTYGSLNAETWQDDIKKGFEECWRVLEDYGILIFKWNDASKKRAELLRIIGREPLFGHPNGSKIPTHWFCFMKFPEEDKLTEDDCDNCGELISKCKCGKFINSEEVKQEAMQSEARHSSQA